MSTFFLQSALLIAVTYFLGAIVGCWLRKLFRLSASMLHAKTVGAGTAVAGAGAVLANQYAGAEGEASIEISRPVPEPVPAPAPIPAAEPEPVRKIYIEEIPESLAVETVVVSEPEPVTYIETEAVSEPEPEPEPEQALVPAAILEPEPEIEIIDPEIREQVVIYEEIVPTISESAPAPAPAIVAPVVTAPVVDDLTRIKGVGLPVALELKKIGVMRFEQVARWTDADVAHVSRQLGFSGRIERENWMDQARILAAGDELEFTTHQLARAERDSLSQQTDPVPHGRGERAARTPRDSERSEGKHTIRPRAPFIQTTRPGHPAPHTARTSVGDLKLIIGIDTDMAEKLNAIGINRLEQVANWTLDEVEALERQLGTQDRIAREKWVQQARQLMG